MAWTREAVCGIKEGKLCIDHNHKTGKVRGVLCHNHNVALGHLQDSPEMIVKLLSYLMEN